MAPPNRISVSLLGGLLALCLAGCDFGLPSNDSEDRDYTEDLTGEYSKIIYGYCADAVLQVRFTPVKKNVVDLTLSMDENPEVTHRLAYKEGRFVPGSEPTTGSNRGYGGLFFALPPERFGGEPRSISLNVSGKYITVQGFTAPSSYVPSSWIVNEFYDSSGNQLAAFQSTHASLTLRYLDEETFEIATGDSQTGPRQIQGSYSLGSFGNGLFPSGGISLSIDTGDSSEPLVNSYGYSCPDPDRMTLAGPAALFNLALGTNLSNNVSLGFEPAG